MLKKNLEISASGWFYYEESPPHVTFYTHRHQTTISKTFQAKSGWNCSSILTLLGSGHQKAA
jgi:hypothetical protein